jgi:hypothetical protein
LRDAIRRTTSAPPGQITRQGQIPKSASAAQGYHSNAPIKPESQSILSKIVALMPKRLTELMSAFVTADLAPADADVSF